jgi:hypothetical protein
MSIKELKNDETNGKTAVSKVGALLGGGGALLINSLFMLIHGSLVPDFLYWNIYWATVLIFVFTSVILIIVGLRLKKKYQIPWFDKKISIKSVILLISSGIICMLLPVPMYVFRPERMFLIKPYVEKEYWLLLTFCEIAGTILIIMGLMLKKKYKLTFLKSKT